MTTNIGTVYLKDEHGTDVAVVLELDKVVELPRPREGRGEQRPRYLRPRLDEDQEVVIEYSEDGEKWINETQYLAIAQGKAGARPA